jgi:hypothetical protein
MSLTFRMAAMKLALACALLICGGTMLTAPARAIDNVMPQPVTDYMPPVTDDTLPRAAAPDTEMPAAPPEAPTPQAEMVPPADNTVPPTACDNCSPPKRYDSQEVIKKIREIDRSRTINTTEMALDYAPRREASPGYRVRSDVTLVNFVVHRYRVIYAPELVSAAEAGEFRPLHSAGGYRPAHRLHRVHRVACRHGKYNSYDGCRPTLRVRG